MPRTTPNRCPQCGEKLDAFGCTQCTWKFASYRQDEENNEKMDEAKYREDGKPRCRFRVVGLDGKKHQCNNIGRISDSTSDKGNLYCGWHYECLNKPRKAYSKKAYKEWVNRQLDVESTKKIIGRGDTWDAEDEYQVKGLVALGENSIAWKKAPEFMRKKARELKASGWTPKNNLMGGVG